MRANIVPPVGDMVHPAPLHPLCVSMAPLHTMQDVKCVRWHPQGEVLASASYDDSIKLWVDEDDEWVCAQTLAGVRRGCWGRRDAWCVWLPGTKLTGCWSGHAANPHARVLQHAVGN